MHYYKERAQAPEHSRAKRKTGTPAVDAPITGKKYRRILPDKAKLIAMDWHSGQSSALYAFGSSGVLLPGSVGRTLREININVRSANLPKSQWRRLQQLEKYIAGQTSAEQHTEQQQTEFSKFNQ